MISVIIPTFNEEETIGALVQYLLKNKSTEEFEIIVSDGGSSDETMQSAAKAGAQAILSPLKGRAAQMNFGASMAKGEVLYFVHADTLPTRTFVDDIFKAKKAGYQIGRYQTKFDSRSLLLKLNAFFTRFDLFMCYGGDQTLFITRELFERLNGFDETKLIMEEYDLVERARPISSYKIFAGKTLVSARKYEARNWWQVQRANYVVIRMYKQGASQKLMVETYKRLLS